MAPDEATVVVCICSTKSEAPSGIGGSRVKGDTAVVRPPKGVWCPFGFHHSPLDGSLDSDPFTSSFAYLEAGPVARMILWCGKFQGNPAAIDWKRRGANMHE